MASRSRFFVLMAAILLLINLVGFAPSYFLKGFFDSPELPIRVHIHGAIFTAWFVLFLVQTSLIANGSVSVHRRVGLAGATLAIAMAITAIVIMYAQIMRFHEPDSGLDLIGMTTFVWGNLILLIAFSAFVTLGICFRRRPEAHKRLMLMASLSMMGQSLGRIGKFEFLQIADSGFMNEVIFGLGGLVVLLLSLVLYDVFIRRRTHTVSLFGAPIFLAAIIVAALVVPYTDFGQSVVLMFG